MSNRVQVLDHGYVELLDSMGSDIDIVNAARTSFDSWEREHFATCASVLKRDLGCDCDQHDHEGFASELSQKDAGLINFLMKNKHMTPFEMVQLKFAVKAPIFVFREWHRHRTFSINEMSGRYVELEREFYVPARDDMREQKGKPGAYYYETIESDGKADTAQLEISMASQRSFDTYERLLEEGVAKEVARLVLPVNTYSKMVWSGDLRCLMQFLALRNHPHAQLEIRRYAEVIEEIAFSVAPVAMGAFVEHGKA